MSTEESKWLKDQVNYVLRVVSLDIFSILALPLIHGWWLWWAVLSFLSFFLLEKEEKRNAGLILIGGKYITSVQLAQLTEEEKKKRTEEEEEEAKKIQEQQQGEEEEPAV